MNTPTIPREELKEGVQDIVRIMDGRGAVTLYSPDRRNIVETLRATISELESLQQWKDSALQVMASWNEVEKFIRKTSKPEDYGKSVAGLVLKRLQDASQPSQQEKL